MTISLNTTGIVLLGMDGTQLLIDSLRARLSETCLTNSAVPNTAVSDSDDFQKRAGERARRLASSVFSGVTTSVLAIGFIVEELDLAERGTGIEISHHANQKHSRRQLIRLSGCDCRIHVGIALRLGMADQPAVLTLQENLCIGELTSQECHNIVNADYAGPALPFRAENERIFKALDVDIDIIVSKIMEWLTREGFLSGSVSRHREPAVRVEDERLQHGVIR